MEKNIQDIDLISSQMSFIEKHLVTSQSTNDGFINIVASKENLQHQLQLAHQTVKILESEQQQMSRSIETAADSLIKSEEIISSLQAESVLLKSQVEDLQQQSLSCRLELEQLKRPPLNVLRSQKNSSSTEDQLQQNSRDTLTPSKPLLHATTKAKSAYESSGIIIPRMLLAIGVVLLAYSLNFWMK